MGLGLGLGLGLDNKFRMPTTSICYPVQKDAESGPSIPPGPSRDLAHMQIQKFYGEKTIVMIMVAGNHMFPSNFISSIHQAVL